MPRLAESSMIEDFLRKHEAIVTPTLYSAGEAIGDWRVCAFIGRGGCGEVYRVEHRKLATTAALKLLSRTDAAFCERFLREARILMETPHPAFPRFLGFGEECGHPYLVIELLEPFPLPDKDRDIADYLFRVCEGVAYLHHLGFVHRDIKPQNIMRRPNGNQPVLIDLGLVKDTSLPPTCGDDPLSIVDGKAIGVGTPKYSAPEQFSGGEISPTADVHALGVLVNECFCGKPPRAWAQIVRRSTSSISTQRYGTVDEFVRAVRRRHSGRVYVAAALAAILSAIPCGILLARHGEVLPMKSRAMAVDRKISSLNVDDGREPPEVVESLISSETNATSRSVEADPPTHPGRKIVAYPRSGVFGGDRNADSDF